MSDNKNTIAFFDFDGTLTKGDTFMPFLKFVVGAPRYYVGLLWLSPIFFAYLLSLISNEKAKEVVIRYYVRGFEYDHLLRLGVEFFQKFLTKKLCSRMIKNLEWHQERGHRCVIVSASPAIYINHFGEQYNFSDVLATELEVSEGKVTGNLQGKNCYGFEKLRLVKEYSVRFSCSYTYAYGDSNGDKPMLMWVDKGLFVQRKKIYICVKVKIENV